MKRRSYKQVTEEEFTRVKALQAAGLTAATIFKVTGRHPTSLGLMFKANDFADYRAIVYAKSRELQAKRKAKEFLPIKGVDEPTEEEPSFVGTPPEKIADVLERLVAAVERLGDLWEAKPDKKRLF